MTRRFILPLLVISLSGLALAAPAGANYRVGISDQSAAMFDQPRFQALGVKRVRYLVPWDVFKHRRQLQESDAFLSRAHSARMDVLVTFTARRGCWTGVRYSGAKACRAPSGSAYEREVERFRKRHPWIRTYAPWNEVNHKSQPTYRSPKLAATYYNVMRRVCSRCTLLAADVLDSSNVTTYLAGFRRFAKGSPRRWGLHNYSDVNRKRSRGTVAVLRAVPGEVWLTETGGIVKFGADFPYSESRAADRIKYMFGLADRYDSRVSGLRSKITRLYAYQWTGAPRGARFDSGLVDADGSPRRGYSVYRSYLRRRLR